jgi:serine/threonine protein kinase
MLCFCARWLTEFGLAKGDLQEDSRCGWRCCWSGMQNLPEAYESPLALQAVAAADNAGVCPLGFSSSFPFSTSAIIAFLWPHRTNSFIGTMEYMAPEIIEGKALTCAAAAAAAVIYYYFSNRANSFIGTMEYMAPEIIEGSTLTAAAATAAVVCCYFATAGPTASLAPWSTWRQRSLRARATAAPWTGGAPAFCCTRC